MADLDMLSFLDMIWESCSVDRVTGRAPHASSAVCTQDSGFFHTTATLVYDMAIELHCLDRVSG
jgi:hypothetical protein